MSKPFLVSESQEFNAYIENTEKGLSDKSKAEAIAAYTQRTIKENYHRDPEFYRKFSDQIEQLIEELKVAKEEDVRALLSRARQAQDAVVDYEDNDIPEPIKYRKDLHPYYRNLSKSFGRHVVPPESLCRIVRDVNDLIEKEKIVDWDTNIEVRRSIRMHVEDYLFDTVKRELGIPLSLDEMDVMLDLIWALAVENKSRGRS
mgnify:CR=1 FL=1